MSKMMMHIVEAVFWLSENDRLVVLIGQSHKDTYFKKSLSDSLSNFSGFILNKVKVLEIHQKISFVKLL